MTQNNIQQEDGMSVPFVMELYAQKARLLLKGAQELLSSGMTGVIQVAFAFSEDWDGLQKTAVFSNGTVSIDVPEESWEANVCTVPQQVLAAAGKTLMVGVYGTDGEELMLPTVWCALGRVEPGAAPAGVDALPPEAPLWARLQKQLGEVAATNPFVVQGLSMITRDDGSVILGLNQSFAWIEAAAQAGRPVFLEVFGEVLPLTRLLAGSRAEFTGPVFTVEGSTYYHFCTVPDAGDALVLTLPVGGTPAEEAIREALAQAKASGEFDGATGPAGPQGEKGDTGPQGADGVSATHSWSGTTLTVTSASGTSSADLKGEKGNDGATGQRGTGILNITTAPSSYTTATGGFTPVYRIALSTVLTQSKAAAVLVSDTLAYSYYHYPVGYVDASYVYLGTRKNIRGATGAAGAKGDKGDPGEKGETGAAGATGPQGPAGADGDTPVRGVDYWTGSDQESIVQQVITALGTPVFGTVDGNNNIILTGNLTDGGYVVKYEDENGVLTTIGTLSAGVTYTNVLAAATDNNGNVLNGTGYAEGYRFSGYGGNIANDTPNTDGYFVTGFIPYTNAQAEQKVAIYIKGITLDLTNLPQYLRVALIVPGSNDYMGQCTLTDISDSSQMTITQLGTGYYRFTPNGGFYRKEAWNTKGTTHIRFTLPGSGSGVIITINEPIE